MLKVNIDATIFEQENVVGLGVVIRDNSGGKILEAGGHHRHATSGAYGRVKGLKLAIELGAQKGHSVRRL